MPDKRQKTKKDKNMDIWKHILPMVNHFIKHTTLMVWNLDSLNIGFKMMVN